MSLPLPSDPAVPRHRVLRALRRSCRLIAAPLLLAGTVALASPPAGAPDSPEPSAEQAAKIFPYAYEKRTLNNGLQVIVIPTPTPGLVSYRTVVRTGARDEYEKGATGFAHFFEHMMFRGTKKYPAEVYNELVTRMGADSNAYTSTDVTVYEFDIAAADLPLVIELEADRFMNLEYDEQAFQTEAGAVYGEYRKNRTSPAFLAYEALRQAAFTKHTYGHTAMGYVEDIKAMPTKFEYSRSFFNRYYRPDNCVIVVAGDLDPAKTFELIEKHYAEWKPGYVAPKIKAEPAQKKERRVEVAYEGKTLPRVLIGYKGAAFAPADRAWVASLVLAELAFGQTSDIYRKLVLDEQSVTSLYAAGATNRDPELWGIATTVKDPAKLDAVIAEIDATVARFRDELADPAKVDAIKQHMKYQFLLGLDTPRAVAEAAVEFVGTTGKLEDVEALYATLMQVTPEDVREAARKWLRNEQRTIVIVREGAPAEAKPAAKQTSTEKKGG